MISKTYMNLYEKYLHLSKHTISLYGLAWLKKNRRQCRRSVRFFFIRITAMFGFYLFTFPESSDPALNRGFLLGADAR